MSGKPRLDLQIVIDRASTALADTLEEGTLIECDGRDTGLGPRGRSTIQLGQGQKLGAVIHDATVRYFYRSVNGTDTACNAVTTAGIMRHMETEIGKRLKDRLDQLGLKARGVSLRIGRSDSYLQNIIVGKSSRPGLEEARKLCEILQVPSNFFEDSYDEQTSSTPNIEDARLSLIQFATGLLDKLSDADLKFYVASLERDVQRTKKGT